MKNEADLRVRRLLLDDTVNEFDCGDADLKDFILREASPYCKALLAVTYVFENKETGEVAAYFSLANDCVSLTDFITKQNLINSVSTVFQTRNG